MKNRKLTTDNKKENKMHDYRVEMSTKKNLITFVSYAVEAENKRLAVAEALDWAKRINLEDVRIQNVIELWW